MCGVLGIIETSPGAIDQLNAAKLMSKAISHRGPDDEGYVVFEDGSAPNTFWSNDTPLNVRAAYPEARDASEGSTKGNLLLGHRRLSILDTSPAGHQPMGTADVDIGLFLMVLYNYIELRSELSALGYVFNTDTDTEVILQAYKEWGENVNKFNGDWALLLYDYR